MPELAGTAPSLAVCGLGDTLALLRDPAGFTAGKGLGLGDFYRIRLPGLPLHVVTDPELAEQILVEEADHFVKSRLYWNELRRSIGDCMGSLDGPRWTYLHRVQLPFFTPKAVGAYLPTVQGFVTRHMDELAQRVDAEPNVPVIDLFAELNARVILSVLFGRHDEPAALDIHHRIADGHAIIAWKAKLPWRRALAWLNGVNLKARRHRIFFSDYTHRLGRSEAAADARLLLNALLRIADDPEAPRFPDTLLRNEIMFHLGASTETQAVTEGWTLYLLWKHPEVLEQLRDEVSRVAGDSGPAAEHVPKLTFTRQVLQEALRLYPTVYAVARDCAEPVELGGYPARRGQIFLVSVCGLHRNPRLWDDPDAFRPVRFHPNRVGSIGRYHYLPFGAGKHVCVGQHLALPAMVLALGHFAQRFDWSFPDADVRPVAFPNLKPSGPFVAAVTRRGRGLV